MIRMYFSKCMRDFDAYLLSKHQYKVVYDTMLNITNGYKVKNHVSIFNVKLLNKNAVNIMHCYSLMLRISY